MNSQERDSTEKYETMPMRQLIFSMALPNVAAQLVNLLYNIVDKIYIGHIPKVGASALAGAGIGNTLIIMVMAFASLVGGGGAPQASIAFGKNDRDRAEKIMNNGLTLALIFSAGLTVTGLIFLKPLLRLCGASEVTMPFAYDYMRIYLAGTVFVQITLGISPFINAEGCPKISFVSVLIGAVTNIILDPIMIFGMNMGVEGAAVATVISQALSAFYILRFLSSDRSILRIRRSEMKPDARILRGMTALGISPFVMTSTEAIIGFVLNGQLSKYGDIYVSALAIMQSCMQVISVPLQGFGQGCIPVISYNFGNHKPKRMKEAFGILLRVSFLYNLLLVILMDVFPAQAASLFTSDRTLINTVREVMPWFMTGMSIFGIQRACQNFFVACNEAKISLIIALLRKIILLIPFVFIFQLFIVPGYRAVYLAESVADASAAICCGIIFLHKYPKIIHSISE